MDIWSQTVTIARAQILLATEVSIQLARYTAELNSARSFVLHQYCVYFFVLCHRGAWSCVPLFLYRLHELAFVCTDRTPSLCLSKYTANIAQIFQKVKKKNRHCSNIGVPIEIWTITTSVVMIIGMIIWRTFIKKSITYCQM
jgi:hypothetical protein